jgi:ribonucleoside-diphosphate reductase alpha chain
MLIRLGIGYDTDKAIDAASEVMRFIDRESKVASLKLAGERAIFENYKGSAWEKKSLPLRNATTTSIAPTGSLSIIAGTSGGIEPIYETLYKRVLFGDIEVEVVDPLYEEMGRKGSGAGRRGDLFRVAHQIAPLRHLQIQRAFQDHVDNAVSKTINLPRGEKAESILRIYHEAHRMGLKGITVFRDRSREYQVLSCGTQVC